MKYIITKEIEAVSIKEALAQEAKGEVIDVTKKDDDAPPGQVGFRTS